MLNQARLDWVTKNLKLTHYIYELASAGDATAQGLRHSIHERAHLTENQIRFAKRHIRDLRPAADLDESTNAINERAA
jgi:hypothetical protein